MNIQSVSSIGVSTIFFFFLITPDKFKPWFVVTVVVFFFLVLFSKAFGHNQLRPDFNVWLYYCELKKSSCFKHCLKIIHYSTEMLIGLPFSKFLSSHEVDLSKSCYWISISVRHPCPFFPVNLHQLRWVKYCHLSPFI